MQKGKETSRSASDGETTKWWFYTDKSLFFISLLNYEKIKICIIIVRGDILKGKLTRYKTDDVANIECQNLLDGEDEVELLIQEAFPLESGTTSFPDSIFPSIEESIVIKICFQYLACTNNDISQNTYNAICGSLDTSRDLFNAYSSIV